MSEPMARPALTPDAVLEAVGVRVTPFVPARAVNLRADPREGGLAGAFESALGLPLPQLPGTVVSAAGLDACWLGPDEWLVLAEAADADLHAPLERAMVGRFASLVDVAAGQQGLMMAGPRAGELLARGCTLDLHPNAFGPGRAARTMLAKTPILLFRRSGEQAFRVIVRRSMAGYCHAWCQAALQRLDGAAAS